MLDENELSIEEKSTEVARLYVVPIGPELCIVAILGGRRGNVSKYLNTTSE